MKYDVVKRDWLLMCYIGANVEMFACWNSKVNAASFECNDLFVKEYFFKICKIVRSPR